MSLPLPTSADAATGKTKAPIEAAVRSVVNVCRILTSRISIRLGPRQRRPILGPASGERGSTNPVPAGAQRAARWISLSAAPPRPARVAGKVFARCSGFAYVNKSLQAAALRLRPNYAEALRLSG